MEQVLGAGFQETDSPEKNAVGANEILLPIKLKCWAPESPNSEGIVHVFHRFALGSR